MRYRRKAPFVALAATLVLAAAVGPASARRLEISNQQIRVVWNALKFAGIGGLIPITCSVTIEGSFHSRTISKISGQLIGYITRAAITRPCSGGGELWTLNGIERPVNTLPWHVRYDRFTGALPSITRIRLQIVGFAFQIEAGGNECLYRATEARPLSGFVEKLAGNEEISGISADPASEIPLKETITGICPGSIKVENNGTVTLLGNTTGIRVRLIA